MDQAGTGTIGRLFGWSRVLRWLAATLGVAAVTFLLSLARVNETAAGLVFLTMVVWFATRAGIRRSLYVAFLCAISFDYYFLPPTHTFRLAGPQEWVEMLSFAVSCVIVGRLAERARSQTRTAEQRREDVERLYRLSQEMMLQEDAARLIRDMPGLIEGSFSLQAVILYVRDEDQFYASIPEVPESIQAGMRALAGGPSVTLPGPQQFSSLALMLGLKPIGALAWRPDALSREVATGVSAMATCALTAVATTRESASGRH